MSNGITDGDNHVSDEEHKGADNMVAVQRAKGSGEQEAGLPGGQAPLAQLRVGPQQDPAGARLLLHSTGAVQVLLPWKRGR